MSSIATSTRPAPPDRCPRCGGAFVCGAAAGQPTCDCFTLALSDTLRSALASQWPGQCLCLPCLRALAGADPSSVPRSG